MEESFEFVYDDCFFESSQSEIVDLAFGIGLGYLNIKGIYKTEKLSKVIRFAEIIDTMRNMEIS